MAARRRWPFSLTVAVVLVGLLVTGGLAWVSSSLYSNTEKRLLALRAHDAAAVLTEVLPGIQTPLASAAALADATRGNLKKFKRFVAPYVGGGPQRPFASISLWRAQDLARGPVATVGERPDLAGAIRTAVPFFAHAAVSPSMSVIGMLQSPSPRLGYAFSQPGRTGPFVAYGESPLPSDRYSAVQSGSAFSDLNYALFLGSVPKQAELLLTSAKRLPLPGHTDLVKVPFGDTLLTFAVSAKRSLAGTFPQRLPWAIAGVGILLTLGAAAMTTRLISRRTQAERLAGRLEHVAEENRRLYAEQRGIAQTLQHALLPDELPQLPGLETAARYEAGGQGVEVGGDWYDLITLDEQRLLLVVGDVSGRGLRAATTMAALRYAIHAYAAQGDPPAAILTKLSKLVSVAATGQLATVLCACVDVQRHEVTLTVAGHLPPLLVSDGGAEFIHTEVGLPIGVDRDAAYTSSTISAPPRATLLAFTDGLVERRGESIDAGLERLRDNAASKHVALRDLVNRVLVELRQDGSDDDTAIAGIRWVS